MRGRRSTRQGIAPIIVDGAAEHTPTKAEIREAVRHVSRTMSSVGQQLPPPLACVVVTRGLSSTRWEILSGNGRSHTLDRAFEEFLKRVGVNCDYLPPIVHD